LNVSSPSGLYGNVGQANYSLAKMGLVGFTQTLAKEGGKKGVFSNCIAPIAGTRMLETVMPANLVKGLKVDHVVSLVVFLCHESCEENGGVYECGGGVYQKVQVSRAQGWTADLKKGDPSAEDIAANIDAITDMDDSELVDFMDGGSKVCTGVSCRVTSSFVTVAVQSSPVERSTPVLTPRVPPPDPRRLVS
jgi:3-hydroxyacyl-CoA dehydrogenase/3a,7a,12a-trihydroxy-5b-cholest-24-enoyl-CoA hydratase